MCASTTTVKTWLLCLRTDLIFLFFPKHACICHTIVFFKDTIFSFCLSVQHSKPLSKMLLIFIGCCPVYFAHKPYSLKLGQIPIYRCLWRSFAPWASSTFLFCVRLTGLAKLERHLVCLPTTNYFPNYCRHVLRASANRVTKHFFTGPVFPLGMF